jgi:hypothetical protein
VASGNSAANAISPAEQQLAVAHRALLHTRGLQLDFANTPPPPKPPAWLDWLLHAVSGAGPLFKFIFWGGSAVGVALVLWLIARELLRWGRRDRRATPASDWRPEPTAARALLEDADRLAGEGRYDEAVHLLLFRSIEELNGRRPGSVRPALTSRDLANLQTVPQVARAAFAHIARAVEHSFFGGRPLAAEDFQTARRQYETYAFAESWQ